MEKEEHIKILLLARGDLNSAITHIQGMIEIYSDDEGKRLIKEFKQTITYVNMALRDLGAEIEE